MARRIRLGAVVLGAALLVGACSGADDRDSSADGAMEALTQTVAEDEAAGGASGGGSVASRAPSDEGAVGEPLPDAIPASVRQSQIIRTAELRIELKKGGFREAFERALFLAGAHQGFVVDSSSERGGDDLASGSVVLRVPTDQFDAARKDLASLGKVQSEQVKGQDVGAELVDLDARLRNLRAQEESLRLLMEKAANVPETMQVQQNLFGVRSQIEQLAAQEARTKDAVAMATIRVTLAESGAALLSTEPEPTGLAGAFAKAVDGAVAVVSALVITVGYLFPLAVLLAIAYLVVRVARRPERVAAAEG